MQIVQPPVTSVRSDICISTLSSEIKRKIWQLFLYILSEIEERHFIFEPYNDFELFHLRVCSYAICEPYCISQLSFPASSASKAMITGVPTV